MKNNKLCVVLPTRMRPELFKRALESYEKNTAGCSDIYFVFQNPMPEFLQQNINIVHEKYPKNYWLMGPVNFLQKVNWIVNRYPDYSAYMVLNDDQVIHTKDFDKMLLDKVDEFEKKNGHRLCIPYWRDSIQDKNLCESFLTHEMKDILKTYYPEGYMHHLYSDNMYMFIGSECGLLEYMPEIYIEHLHCVNGKAPVDQSYQETNSAEAYQRDGAQYVRWLQENGVAICEKILRQTMKNETVETFNKKIEEIQSHIKEMLQPNQQEPTQGLPK